LDYSALLRDVGNIGIDPGLLDRAGELTEEEMMRVRQHPVVGQTILSSFPFLWDVPRIVRHHHERYDGTGYPDCLQREQIPLCSRILAVADVFDALTSKRPYRCALAQKDALEVIMHGPGSQFDPGVVKAFVSVHEEHYDLVVEDLHSRVVQVLSLMVEANRRDLGSSNRRVSSLAVAMGAKRGCSGEELRDLDYSALLRDVGNIGIDTGLLDRPGELTEEEMARVRQHPIVGQTILSSFPFVWNAPRIVRHHHERYDVVSWLSGKAG
ncbi:MAG: HD domain-containing phosphohydrolase, partial [Chloroflexota bacterium]